LNGFLVDTDVLSEPSKTKPDAAVVAWLREHEADLYTSAVVIGELAWGVERLPAGRKRHDLEAWLTKGVIDKMAGRILRFDTRVALEWAALQGRLEGKGQPMPWRDSLIAATALRHRLIIATRNVRDYQRSMKAVVNPFGR